MVGTIILFVALGAMLFFTFRSNKKQEKQASLAVRILACALAALMIFGAVAAVAAMFVG